MKRVSPEMIRESNLIEGIDDRKADIQSWNAWKWLRRYRMISQPVLLELHKRITHGQLSETESGRYRQIQVYVGPHTPPPPMVAHGQIYGLIVDLMEKPKELDPIATHVRFEKIHPFVDGNGRTGRMLLWWHQLKIGQNPSEFSHLHREEYYQLFRENES